LNEQLKFLIALQELDSAIMSIAEKIELLPLRLKQFETPLKEASESYQKSKTKNDTLNKKKKDKELQLDEIQDKISKLKSKSSDIKTNKEYEAHLKETKVYEQNMSKIEDEILIIMEEVETFEKDVKEEEVKIKKAEDEFREQEKILGEELKKLEAELEKEKAKRNEFSSRLDEENYHHYMNVMKRFGDKAVVETKNEICLGCNTNIPPQLFNDIKKNEDLHRCFYCKRFLYYKEPPVSDKQDKGAAPIA